MNGFWRAAGEALYPPGSISMTSEPNLASFPKPGNPPDFWPLDPGVTFLNHGSFGSCPRPVLEFQRALRERLERQPIQFLVRELEPRLDAARDELARFVGANADDLVFVPNATTGVNAVLRSLLLEEGDEILVTDHEYNACRNAVNFAAERARARVVVAAIPFPLPEPSDVVERLLERVSSRTRLAVIDHVTSQTGLVLPIEAIVRAFTSRGIDILVDGAHAPGMVPLNLESLETAYYTGNCHKWICAPKGAGFLHVRRDRQTLVRPPVISHGANSPRTDRSRFQIEFAWTGTYDPSAFLSVPEALRVMGAQLPGGWPELMQRNRALAHAARRTLCDALRIQPPCPEEMIGSLASLPMPDAPEGQPSKSPLYLDPLQDRLLERHGIEVPFIPWPAWPKRLLRVSSQLYNSLPQYERLAKALAAELAVAS
jgi:isopenicillin-N epimerase